MVGREEVQSDSRSRQSLPTIRVSDAANIIGNLAKARRSNIEVVIKHFSTTRKPDMCGISGAN
jgi:hypothetical protein